MGNMTKGGGRKGEEEIDTVHRSRVRKGENMEIS